MLHHRTKIPFLLNAVHHQDRVRVQNVRQKVQTLPQTLSAFSLGEDAHAQALKINSVETGYVNRELNKSLDYPQYNTNL